MTSLKEIADMSRTELQTELKAWRAEGYEVGKLNRSKELLAITLKELRANSEPVNTETHQPSDVCNETEPTSERHTLKVSDIISSDDYPPKTVYLSYSTPVKLTYSTPLNPKPQELVNNLRIFVLSFLLVSVTTLSVIENNFNVVMGKALNRLKVVLQNAVSFGKGFIYGLSLDYRTSK